MTRFLHFWWLLPLIGLCAGCGAGPAPAAVVRDSAGITIVENARPAWTGTEAWRLSDEPLVRIPGDSPEYQFFRAWLATRMSDGRIVVGNRAGAELMVFSPAGRFVGKIGRRGEGPGEFRDLTLLHRGPADTLYVFDWTLARVAVYDAAGALVRSFSIRDADGFSLSLEGRFRDGTMLFSGTPEWGEPTEPGLARDSFTLHLGSAEGQVSRRIGRFPARDVFAVPTADGFGMTAYPFSRLPSVAVGQDRFTFGYGDRNQVETWTPEGLQRIVRWPGEPRAVTDADREAYREWRVRDHGRLGASRQHVEGRIALMGFPERMPTFGLVLMDASGNLWVDDYTPESRPDHSPLWRVFSPDGIYLGDVQFPPRFHAMEIGTDYVLGRLVDEFEVEDIVVYPLRR